MKLNKYNAKRWMQHLGFGLLAIGSLSACIMDDKGLPDCPEIIPAKDPLVVTASLYCQNTKIEWQEDSRIGLILLDGDSDKPIYPAVSHEFYLQNPLTEIFLPARGVPSVERPEVGVTLDATGVYPYGATVNDRLEIAFSVADQSNQQKLDLITAERTTGITHATDTVHINYYRRLSRLQFNLSLTEISADGNRKNADDKLAGATIEVDGMDLSGLFSLKTHALSTSSPAAFKAYVQNDGKSGQAIVFPRQAGKGITFKVRLPQYRDTLYTFAMDPELVLVSCKSYKFDMKLEYKHASGGVKPDPTPDPDPKPDPDPDPTPDPDPKPDPNPGPDPNPDVPAIRYHKVEYVFEGAASPYTVSVYKYGETSPWGLNEKISVQHGHAYSFSFTYNSSSSLTNVKVRYANGTTIAVKPGEKYTFNQVTADIKLIISAEVIPPTPAYYVATYELKDGLTASDLTMKAKNNKTDIASWGEHDKIQIKEGDPFSMTYTTTASKTVTVILNGKVLENTKSGQENVISNVYQNLRYELTSKPVYTVTLSVSLPDEQEDSNTQMLNGDTFEYTPPAGVNVILKKDGVVQQPVGGKYSFKVTRNMVITVVKEPDANKEPETIKADVHIWVERPEVDGGIISPEAI